MVKSFDQIAASVGRRPTKQSDAPISVLLTDSRSLTYPEKSLFFAIRTEGGDGHRFIPDLYREGVRHFVVQSLPNDVSSMPEASFIVVDDSLEALGAISADFSREGKKMVAIAGSKGKTIVKEWIYSILRGNEHSVRSPRSFNSKIGVPLSLWEVGEDTETAVIETGISRRGEMEVLARLVRPDAVVFTCLSSDHEEGFSSLEEKAVEKAVIAGYPTVNTVVYPADEPLLSTAVEKAATGKRLVGWSFHNSEAALYVYGMEKTAAGTRIQYIFNEEHRECEIPFSEKWEIDDALAVLAFLEAGNYPQELIRRGMSSLSAVGLRLNVTEGVNGCSVIYDSFTPDFPSLVTALDFMRRHEYDGQSRTVILSDLIVPPGIRPEKLYEDVSSLLRRYGIDRIIGVGESISEAASVFPVQAVFYPDAEMMLASLSPADFSEEIVLVKGSAESGLAEIAENLEARKHETVLEVNLDSLAANYNYFRRNVPEGTGIIAMVKASGYGAGSFEVSRTMQERGASYLAVAVLDEGVELRKRGITMPIMVMNPKVVNYKSMFAYRLEPEIYSLDMLRDVARAAERYGVTDYPVHVKLDTGMHRLGFMERDIPALIEFLRDNSSVRLRSLFSHLATADCPDMDDYTFSQLNLFRDMTERVMKDYPHPVMRHILNSAGILRFPAHAYDMVRLGIGLYGVNTLPPEMEEPLAVVCALKSVIISIRTLEAGQTVGYGRKGVLTRRSRIATVPIGYADGMDRRFGCGAISVKVGDGFAPTVGNICMDACMIDVTDIDCSVGDSVEIFGPDMPVERLSGLMETIPYEVLTSVSPRVKRIYYRE